MRTLNNIALILFIALLAVFSPRFGRLWGSFEAATEAQGTREGRRYFMWVLIVLGLLILIRELFFAMK